MIIEKISYATYVERDRSSATIKEITRLIRKLQIDKQTDRHLTNTYTHNTYKDILLHNNGKCFLG